MARKLRRKPRKPLREEIWNLPNILTYGRILMIPVVMYFLYQCEPGVSPLADDPAGRLASFWATLVFCGAAATDFFDGWVARNFNLGSMVGRFLDPLADKLIVMACLVMLVQLDRIPSWFVVLLLAREISITSLRAIASQEGLEIRVDQTGKWKTAFQLCGLIGVLLHYQYKANWGFLVIDFDYHGIGFSLLVISMAFSIWSAGLYFFRFAAVAAEDRRDEE